jgi:Tfp pilus assembly protein PilX
MNLPSLRRTQRGATLVVSLIMLVLISLLVTGAFTMSTTNLKAVGNMQNRNEAIAAGNKAIEQVLSSPFTDSPAAESIDVDIDNNGKTDYRANFATPTCISASRLASTVAPPSSISLGPAFTVATSNFYETVWDLDANVIDTSGSGAAARIRQGVRVLLSQTKYNAVCS